MLVVWLVYKFISSAFSALEAKYCDNDCVDEEDEARSSSGVLILALRCEISAALEPDLKQNFIPANFFRGISVRFLSWECWDFLKTTRSFPKIPEEVRSLPNTYKVFRSLRTRINASSLPVLFTSKIRDR